MEKNFKYWYYTAKLTSRNPKGEVLHRGTYTNVARKIVKTDEDKLFPVCDARAAIVTDAAKKHFTNTAADSLQIDFTCEQPISEKDFDSLRNGNIKNGELFFEDYQVPTWHGATLM